MVAPHWGRQRDLTSEVSTLDPRRPDISPPERHPTTTPAGEPTSFRCVVQYSIRGAAWIRLSGELDLTSAPQLTHRINKAIARARLIVIDLRQLTFIDAAGLRILTDARTRARAAERRLVLIRGTRQVDRTFTLSGLSDQFEVFDLMPHAASPSAGGRTSGSDPTPQPPARADIADTAPDAIRVEPDRADQEA